MNEPYNQYSLLLDRTARKVKWYAQRQFEKLALDLTVDQWLILKVLSEQGEFNQKDLAANVYKDMPTVTRIVDILTAKGLVQRVVHPEDRRSFLIRLTDEGLRKVRSNLDKIRDIRLKAWEGLSEQDFSEFNRILNRIYQNLDGRG